THEVHEMMGEPTHGQDARATTAVSWVTSPAVIARRLRRAFAALLVAAGGMVSAQDATRVRLELSWPTANAAYARGEPLEAFVQPTVSGEVTSGLFGCVRNDGTRFHEAVDLKPIGRDARGEPTDQVFAALDRVVRHVSRRPGLSSY